MSEAERIVAALPEERLHEWVLEQRWFASKAREVAHIGVLEAVTLREQSPALVLALVEARFHTGTHELYQLPLGLRPDDEEWDDLVLADVEGQTVYDALADAELGRELLGRLRGASEVEGEHGSIRFRSLGDGDGNGNGNGGGEAGGRTRGDADVRPVGVEQSNSSVVLGDELILKVFRRLEPGVNPELELLRFLSEREFEHIAPLTGWYEYSGRLVNATLGTLQRYLTGAHEGWALCLSDLEGFVPHARDLGAVTGRLHACLGSAAGDPDFASEEPSTENLSLLTATVDEEIERMFVDLDYDDPVLGRLAGRSLDVRERLQALSHIGAGGRLIRTHGDYHLGQTMLTDRGWVILDFEGEPARSLPERRRKRSPLRDVAGILRSFAYAASAAEQQSGVVAPEGWEERARAAFLEGYFEAVDSSLLPHGQAAIGKLLSVFELEKAVYELRYELNNRPDWVAIPVAGIERLLDADE
ncbi:MAG TPA: phosphotransferase [Solirubrobacteraceae bacterium]|nr:phosphotransferase [Solirubrobacteraceae bacterium]